MRDFETGLTQRRLGEVLRYDPDSGAFSWVCPKKAARAKVGTICLGYLKIAVDGRQYLAHRLAWLLIHGAWPNIVDHINGIKLDNRISNLRSVSQQENAFNRVYPSALNRSGLVGATRSRKRWRSQISVRGRKIPLGYFATAEQAHDTYIAARNKLHSVEGGIRQFGNDNLHELFSL